MRYLAYILMLISINSLAQLNGDWIKSGQIKLRVNADGQMATFNNSAASEFVEGSNNHVFKFINLWISGYDSANNLYITTVNGFNNKSDYSPGPIDYLTFIGANPDSFNFVWSVTAADIKEHIKNFQNKNYVVPEPIKNWPSNGSSRYNKYLAPFIDYDKNDIYEPAKGDYPEIIGEKSSFFIVNDNYSEHKASGGQPLKIEIYGMAYTLQALSNTIFVKYFITNRTDKNFKNIKVSLHSGFQLGNENDNYCGTIVSKNVIFSYNGDANDENHFGTNKPLASLMILNKNISSSLYISNDLDEYSGMPVTPENHRNMMDGKWKNSNSLTFGSNGKGNNPSAKFIYPGNTDPAFGTQNWEENSLPGLRSMLVNVSSASLFSKGFIELDLAVSGYDKSDGNPYEFLTKKAGEIKTQWEKQVSSAIHKIEHPEYILKNPVTRGEDFYQTWFTKFNLVTIYNQLGQQLYQINTGVENRLIIELPGIYYITLQTDNQIITKKILIL